MNLDEKKLVPENFGTLDNKVFGYQKFQDFWNSVKNYFVSRFSFEGDEEFTEYAQILFLNVLFDYGTVGIKKVGDKRVPVIITPKALNYDGTIATAWGWKANLSLRQQIIKKETKYTYNNLTLKDTAFMKWDLYGNSGFSEIYTNSYLYGETFATIRNNIKLTMEKYQIRNNDEQSNKLAEAIYSITSEVVKTNDKYASKKLSDIIHNKITEQNIIGGNEIKKILDDENFKPYIEELIKVIETVKNDFSEMYGRRRNTHEKQERNINAEFANDNQNYSLLEKRILPYFKKFIEEYKNVFNVELELIDELALLQENEEQEQEQIQEQQQEQIQEQQNEGRKRDDKKTI